MIGQNIEHYKVVAMLGEGGMGIVYKAIDLKLERYIALKILSPHALRNPRFVERFKREARNQAKLTHSNIVPVYGFTEDNNVLGIVMEFVEGETLEHLIQRKKRLALDEALMLLQQILKGIGYAHSKGFIHRDIKPSNIIINKEGNAKIMDFGISKSINDASGITRTGAKIGTILYMSPEQVKAQEPTQQSDIYSIGITFYEMLAGRTPFDFDNEYDILEAHLKKNPAKLSFQLENIPSEVDGIIGKSLNKSIAKRYQTCEEFLIDFEKLSGVKTSPVKAKKKKKKEKTTRHFNGNILKKIGFVLLTFIIITIFAGVFYFVYTRISEFWINENYSSNEVSKDFNNYRTNPGFVVKSNWKTIISPTNHRLNSISFADASTGFACGVNNALIKTTDGGKTWQIVSDSGNVNLFKVKFISENAGFIAGEKGTLKYTKDGGLNWGKINLNLSESIFNIYFLKNSEIGFLIGNNGIILKTYNSGVSWKRINIPSHQLLFGIAFANAMNGFIVGWDGTILKSTNQGDTWTPVEKISDKYLRDIFFINDKVGFIVGGGGEIFRTSDAGESWELLSSNTISGLYSVYFFNEKSGMILGAKGEILTTEDSGLSWENTPSGVFTTLTSLAELPLQKVILVGDNGTILTNSK